jgi:hypothetical protein
MAILQKAVRNALVFYDDTYTHRWYDAIGAGVIKHLEEFLGTPSDDSTGDPTGWMVTLVEIGANTSTMVVTDRAGGAALIETAGNENDGWSMQLGAAAGENVDFTAPYWFYGRCDFAINDVDQTDFFWGLSVTDTAILGGSTDSIGFRSVDASAVLNFITEKDSIESSTAVATLADGVYIATEFLVDATTVYHYVNGALTGSVARSTSTFPDDEQMRLSLEFLTGEAVQNTCTVERLKMIHIR